MQQYAACTAFMVRVRVYGVRDKVRVGVSVCKACTQEAASTA